MRSKTGLYILSIFFLFSACTSGKSPFNSEKEWSLAWSVWEMRTLDQDFLKGAKLFDSLLQTNTSPPIQILMAGIHCYAATNQYSKAFDVLNSLPDISNLDLCGQPWFSPPETVEWRNLCLRMETNGNIAYPDISNVLIAMYINDQVARGRELGDLIRETRYKIQPHELYNQNVQAAEKINIEKLKLIVDEIGFPDRNMVGEIGVKCAHTILRNANQDPNFQESMLPNLWEAALKGDILLEDYGFIVDQIAINKGNLPVLGTHFSVDAYAQKKPMFDPPLDEALANEKRKELGMMPIETVKKWFLYSFNSNVESRS